MNVPRALLISLLAGLLLLPAPAHAHAAFVSSDPAPGERLENTPGVVRLTFSEPLNVRLSRATVVAPSGERFRAAAPTDRTMTVRIQTNAPGEYEVRWISVSPLDGHTLRGSFRFGVKVTPSHSEATASTGPRAGDALLAVARTIEYAGLLAAGGMLLLLRLARRRPPIVWVRPRLVIALSAALVGGLVVTAGEALSATGSVGPRALADYFTSGLAGLARVGRVAAEVVAVCAAASLSGLAAAAFLTALTMLAAAGHAAAVRPAWWGITVDAAHLAFASIWAGGILAIATMRPPQDWRGDEGEKLLDRFAPIALNAFALTVATGILRAMQELASPLDLVRSSYGRVLAAKLFGVLLMIPLSVRAWRRLSGSFRREAVITVAVVAAAALLAAYPLPPGRAEEAEETATQARASETAVPREADLTLGEGAGRTLVGLTLRPGLPGRNEALVFLLPLNGAEGAKDVQVQIKTERDTIATESCGLTCRRAVVRVGGDERLNVHVSGPEGGSATFDVPKLPTRDGRELVSLATQRMRVLETLRMSETLGPADPIVRSEYAFVAPDRLRLEASTGYRLVAVGRSQFQRGRGSNEWIVSRKAPPLTVPLLTWTGFNVVAARVLGPQKIDGVDSTVVAFFTGTTENPIWFRLWVGRERLVHRMEMRARGHFMDQRFFGFNQPIRIDPPSVTNGDESR